MSNSSTLESQPKYAWAWGWRMRVSHETDGGIMYYLSAPDSAKWALLSSTDLAAGRAKLRAKLIDQCHTFVTDRDLDSLLGWKRRGSKEGGCIGELVAEAHRLAEEETRGE